VVRKIVYRSGTQTLLAYHWYEGSHGLALETARAMGALDASPLRLPGEILVVRLVTDVETPIAVGLAEAEQRLAAFYGELRPVLDRVQLEAQIGWRKPFPEFPGREIVFREPQRRDSDETIENQQLERKDSLGMSLANQGSRGGGARAVWV